MTGLAHWLGGWEGALAALLAAGLIGYRFGRKAGRAAGYEEGLRYAPLAWRHTAWFDGKCPLCHTFLGLDRRSGVE